MKAIGKSTNLSTGFNVDAKEHKHKRIATIWYKICVKRRLACVFVTIGVFVIKEIFMEFGSVFSSDVSNDWL